MNKNNIEMEIIKKNNWKPYFSTVKNVKQVTTEYNEFPYSYWFRGIANYDEPIVADREAGWREIDKEYYTIYNETESDKTPKHCFQGPCTTITRCNPDLSTKYIDRKKSDMGIYNSCVQTRKFL